MPQHPWYRSSAALAINFSIILEIALGKLGFLLMGGGGAMAN